MLPLHDSEAYRQLPLTHIGPARPDACLCPQLTGSGRYPFLAIEHAELDFSQVLVGEEAEQATVLWNRGEVATDFDVVPTVAEPSDDVFKVVAAR